MAIRVGSSASEDFAGDGKRMRRRREKRKLREGGMFVSRENGKEKVLSLWERLELFFVGK